MANAVGAEERVYVEAWFTNDLNVEIREFDDYINLTQNGNSISVATEEFWALADAVEMAGQKIKNR